MSSLEWQGCCLCGRVSFKARGTPLAVHHCHCGMCRRATGAAFATLVWFALDVVQWQGDAPMRWRSSAIAERGFCVKCGTSLTLRYLDEDRLALLIGSFDRPEALTPTHHYGIESRLPWADIARDLPEQVTDVIFPAPTRTR